MLSSLVTWRLVLERGVELTVGVEAVIEVLSSKVLWWLVVDIEDIA